MELYERILAFIADPSSGEFGELALACFAHQFEAVAAYQAVCRKRGATPSSISDWRDIPPVPTLAFKHTDLCAGVPERVFLTTGTTQGNEQRGRHAMPDLRLYRAAALAGLQQFVFPDLASMRIFSLIHAAEERPQSSLAQMATWAIEEFATSSALFVHDQTIDFEGLATALRGSERDGEPTCLLATTGALIHFLDHCRDRGWRFRLAHGSRLMDTGGDKGAPRRLSRQGLLHAVWDTFAIPGYFVANEYGMTEMSSQFYDNVICARHAGQFRHRTKAGPHWVRTRVLDPISLKEVEVGAEGVLCHTDLANAGSALTVLTEDIGRINADGFEIRGRVQGAEARGCSLALADFLLIHR